MLQCFHSHSEGSEACIAWDGVLVFLDAFGRRLGVCILVLEYTWVQVEYICFVSGSLMAHDLEYFRAGVSASWGLGWAGKDGRKYLCRVDEMNTYIYPVLLQVPSLI